MRKNQRADKIANTKLHYTSLTTIEMAQAVLYRPATAMPSETRLIFFGFRVWLSAASFGEIW